MIALLAAAAAAPTPVPDSASPAQVAQAIGAFLGLARFAYSVGTLVSIAVAALAGTYLLMYVLKTLIKTALVPEKYAKVMKAVLGVLSVVAGVLGYLLGGPLAGAAAVAGAAASSPLHDVVDGVRGLKRMAVSAEKERAQ